MKWLYSDDKDIYNIIKLEQNSLPMKSISEPIYSRYNEWKQLNEQYNIMKQLITEKTSYYTSLEDKIKKGEVTDININSDKISKIQQIIQQEFNNLEVIIYQTDKEQKIKMPSIKSNDVQNLINEFNKKIENILK